MGLRHLTRLRHIRALLGGNDRHQADDTILACYSAAGFTDDLRAAAGDARDVLLIGIDELYRN